MAKPQCVQLADTIAVKLQPYVDCRHWYVACSGGIDSMVLLHNVQRIQQQQPHLPLTVVHVHHHLQAEADQWAAQIYAYCRQHDLDFRLFVLPKKPAQVQSVEQWARQQRYQIFNRLIGKGDLLLMAHHANDQMETMLWHAVRGCGLDGLLGMPSLREVGEGMLLRPLLAHTKAEICVYQQQFALPYVVDPSNQNTQFSRNYLRHKVVPPMVDQWPYVAKSFVQMAGHLNESAQLLEKYLQPQFAKLFVDDGLAIDIDLFKSYALAEQRWFLRFWLKQFALPCPSAVQLDDAIKQIVGDNQSAQLGWQQDARRVDLRKYQNKLFLVRALPKAVAPEQDWVVSLPLIIYQRSITAETLFSQKQLAYLDQACVQVMFGEAGATVKKFWQTRGVPPWCRPYLPRFYLGGRLLHEVNYQAVIAAWHYRYALLS